MKLYHFSNVKNETEYLYITDDENEFKEQMERGDVMESCFNLSGIKTQGLPTNRRLVAEEY